MPIEAIFQSVQLAWLARCTSLYYDQVEDSIFLHNNTCVWAFKQGSLSLVLRKKDVFLTVGYTNWKEAAAVKSGGFPIPKDSEVACKLSRSCLHVAICFIKLHTFLVHKHLQSQLPRLHLYFKLSTWRNLCYLCQQLILVSECTDVLH